MEWILNNIGNIYGKLNLPEEEIKAYEYSIKINPYMPEAHYNLGISYDKKVNTIMQLFSMKML